MPITPMLFKMLNRINHNDYEESNDQDSKYFCGFIMSILLLFILTGLIICYFAFGIMFLIDDYNIANNCERSNLWEYILVSLIVDAMSTFNSKKERDINENSILIVVFYALIYSGLSCWGGVELFVKSCKDLSGSKLWIFGIIAFSVQIFVSFVSIVIPIIIPLYLYNVDDSTSIERMSDDITVSRERSVKIRGPEDLENNGLQRI